MLAAAVFCVLAVASSTVPCASAAKLAMPTIFGSSMVLSQDKANIFWGWGEIGTHVSVSLTTPTGVINLPTATVDAVTTMWNTTSPLLTATKPGQAVTIQVESSNGDSLSFTDVAVGLVFVVSGQSNGMTCVLIGGRGKERDSPFRSLSALCVSLSPPQPSCR